MMKRCAIILLCLLPVLRACGGEETPETPDLPEAPADLVLHSSTKTSLTFQWKAMEHASGYSWSLAQGSAEIAAGTTRSRNVTVDDLTEGTSYTFSVRSQGADGYMSAASTLVAATQKEETPPPGPVNPPVEGEIKYGDYLIPSAEEDGAARAFPGAEGGGMYVTGGRGGAVFHVTNLNDSGEGSFRWAVTQKGARTVVFDVAGLIELQSDVRIKQGDLTIAGQTAPGDGICIKNYTVNVDADNVIIRFLRFRLGDEAPWTDAQIKNGSADGEDCIWGRYHDGIVLDHCSMSWSVDECASFYANSNFTMQWCILAESMKNCKLHSKGNHGYGGIWGGENASFHHNLLAHHDSRNARLDHPHIYENHNTTPHRGNVDYRNNVIYDWGSNSTYGGERGRFNVVGNYYKPGLSSSDRKYFLDLYAVYSSCSSCGKNVEDGYASVYISGNVHGKYADISSDNASGINWHNGEGHTGYGQTLSSPLEIKASGNAAFTTTHSADDALNAVCTWAGASLSRDKVDKRITSGVLSGTGKIIDNTQAVYTAYGYVWPGYKASEEDLALKEDTDADGMPDWFEDAAGLDKSTAADGPAYGLDPKARYTNLEMYLHYLVKDIVAGQNGNGTYTKL